MNFAEWFAAYRRSNPNAVLNAKTKDGLLAKYRAWQKNNPQDPGEGGPGYGRIPTLDPATGQAVPYTPPAAVPAAAPRPVDNNPTISQPGWSPSDNGDLMQTINLLEGRRTGLVGTGNLDRETAGREFQRRMQDTGYWMPSATDNPLYKANATDNPANTGTNLTYSFDTSQPGAAEGAIYRQTYMQSLANAARGGQAGGSNMRSAWMASYNDLNRKREQAIRGYDQSQRDSVTAQGKADDALLAQISPLRAQNTAYRAGQEAPSVANPNYNPTPSGAPNATAAGTPRTFQYSVKPNTSQFDEKYGAGNWKVTSSGKGKNQKWTVTTTW